MKISPNKKALLLLTLTCVSTSVLADFRNREMGERYRQRHQKMDICAEIKEDLALAQNAFYNFEDDQNKLSGAIKSKRQVLQTKKQVLQARQQEFNQTNTRLADLKHMKKNKPQLVRRYKRQRDEANRQIPVVQDAYNSMKKRKDDKCDWRGDLRSSCRKAKRRLKDIGNRLNPLVQKRNTATAKLNELKKIGLTIQRTANSLEVATVALNAEQTATPTVVQLTARIERLIEKRRLQTSNRNKLERRYGRLEIRAEKCKNMKYQAKKGKAFRNSIMAFTEVNGCDSAMSLLSQARGKARKDGINEAYDLVCKSDRLIREVNTNNGGNCQSTSTPRIPNTRIEFIEDFFTTGNPYPTNLRSDRSYGDGELEKVFTERGAKKIKVDIANIDVEANYDYIRIEDGNGKVLAEKITNAVNGNSQEVPYGNYSTGWINGDTIKVILHSDGRGERSGFEITGFEVQY